MPTTDESRLIGEAQRGSGAAFEELVRRHDRRVLGWALRLVRSEEEARDVYQEVFLRVFQALPRFRHECRFESWLFRIVSNVCTDRVRRAAARAEGAPAWSARTDQQGTAAEAVADERPDGDPERALQRRELRRRIDAAVDTLPARERLVFELRHGEGMRLRDIAEILETSEDTVKNCLFRAHRRMRLALGDAGPAGAATPGRSSDAARAGA